MNLITPLDYWRAGFDFWLAAWKAQIELNDRLLLSFAPARPESASARAGESLSKPVRRSAA